MLLVCTLILATVFTALAPQTAWADRWSFAGTNARYLLPGSYGFAQPITLPDGRLLAVSGGFDGINVGMHLYDPATDTWTAATPPSHSGALTLLPDGRVLAAGGRDSDGNAVATAEIYNPATGVWTPVAPMGTARLDHSATTLSDGRVLVVGGDGTSGAEIYDPTANTWTPTAAIAERFHHSATLLADGRVLVAGGYDADESTRSDAVVYDATANTWTPTEPMAAAHGFHRGLRLADGNVLVIGGSDGNSEPEMYDPVADTWTPVTPPPLAISAQAVEAMADGRVLLAGGFLEALTPPFFRISRDVQIYDPATNTWSSAPSLATARFARGVAQRLADGRIVVLGLGDLPAAEFYDPTLAAWTSPVALGRGSVFHSASLLTDGRVLVAGGVTAETFTADTDTRLYDPSTNTWSQADSMNSARMRHQGTTLANGRVLVTGGDGNSDPKACELYDPTTNQWNPAPSMATGRYQHTATRLQDGRVLVVGGRDASATNTVELYDADANAWSPGEPMLAARYAHSATLLGDGRVLVAGGRDASVLDSAEIYDPVADAWSTVDAMNQTRRGHTGTLLADGRVLVTGDEGSGATDSAEIYDPVSNEWSVAAPMLTASQGQAAVRLVNGEVLVIGGSDSEDFTTTCERYDPATNAWSEAASMVVGGPFATLTALTDGSVLAAGGAIGEFPSSSAERYFLTDTACPVLPDITCQAAGKSSLALKRASDPSKSKLAWKWSKGASAVTQADFGDPVDGSSGYALCLYDETGGSQELVLEMAVEAAGTCSGKPCWKAVSDKGWAYKSKLGNADGVTKVALKGGAAGKPMLQFAGKGASLDLPTPVSGAAYFAVDTAVTVQLHRDDDSRCWTNRYEAASVKKNDAEQFKAATR